MPLFILFVSFLTVLSCVIFSPDFPSIATFYDSFFILSFQLGGVGSAYQAVAAKKLSFVSDCLCKTS